MAVLTTSERKQIWRGLMRYWSNLRETLAGIDKAELQTAVDNIDSWINNNQATINNQLPATFKGNATQAQKTALFCAVAARRVSKEFARSLFGEVD